MSHTNEMLKAYPGSFDADAALLAAAVEALIECASICTQCADACLSEQDVKVMVKCIRLDLDCADICSSTSRVLARQTAYDASVTRAVLEACVQVCKACGAECEHHGHHMAHCKICAETCRRCEQACSALLDSIS